MGAFGGAGGPVGPQFRGEGQQRGFENQGPYIIPRRKSGLETPIVGRFYRESTRLIFAPPVWYDALVLACIVGGVGVMAWCFMGGESWWFFIAILVAIAGFWGALSNERMSCDLRKRTYARLEGQRLFKRVTRGSLDELDAVVLTAEEAPLQLSVIYRLVIHWKHQRHPLLIVDRERVAAVPGMPLNYGAQNILQRGARYAQALGLPFYDNSHIRGRAPISPV